MTPELKAKLLRYANEREPFTAHNHIEITDIGEGRSEGLAVQSGGGHGFPGNLILPRPKLLRFAHVGL